jgi:hypothetical protein
MSETQEEAVKIHHDLEREKTRKRACSECGKRIKPIFKATPDPLDWIFRECETCHEEFCKECSFEDETTGIVQCYTCYESSLHKRLKSARITSDA